jgi:8-oxo-dGTP pyrophosphatase MutT (NUDIX family)
MPRIASRGIEVHVFRRVSRRVEFLALRRSADRRRLPGVWQPVTGKIRPRERALDAALREVFEETGLEPKRWWVLENPLVYFDAAEDAIELLPLFAAEVPARARVVLSREHDAFRFLSGPEAGRRYVWAAQRRALDACRREVLRGGARPIAAAVLAPRARRRDPRRATRRPTD